MSGGRKAAHLGVLPRCAEPLLHPLQEAAGGIGAQDGQQRGLVGRRLAQLRVGRLRGIPVVKEEKRYLVGRAAELEQPHQQLEGFCHELLPGPRQLQLQHGRRD